MLNEGQRIFSAVYKRTYRSLKEEFRKLYTLNSLFLNDVQHFYSLIFGASQPVYQQDFFGDSKDIVPVADPNLVSSEQKLQRASLLKQASASTPGYNVYAVEKLFLEAMQIPDVESVYPDPKGPNAIPTSPDAKIVIETMKLKQAETQFNMDLQFKMFDLQQQIKYLNAEIEQKEAQAVLFLAQAEGVQSGHQIASIQTAIGLAKQKQDGLVQALTILKDMHNTKVSNEQNGGNIENDIRGRVGQLASASNDQGVSQDAPAPDVGGATSMG